MRRAGELLEEFQAKNQYDADAGNGAGTGTENSHPSTQREAAEQAGMSKGQETTATRVLEAAEETLDCGEPKDHPEPPPGADL